MNWNDVSTNVSSELSGGFALAEGQDLAAAAGKRATVCRVGYSSDTGQATAGI